MSTLDDIREYQHTRDIKLRNKIIEDNLGLVKSNAIKFNVSDDIKDDVINEGVLGLIEAIERFDCDAGASLSTYAYFKIRDNMRKYIRSMFSGISFINRRDVFKAIYSKLYLLPCNIHSPNLSIKDIQVVAAAAKVTIKDVEEFIVLCTGTFHEDTFIHEPENNEDLMISIIASLNQNFSSRDCLLMYKRLIENKTFKVIGSELGVPKSTTAKLYLEIVEKLREEIA